MKYNFLGYFAVIKFYAAILQSLIPLDVKNAIATVWNVLANYFETKQRRHNGVQFFLMLKYTRFHIFYATSYFLSSELRHNSLT